MIRNCPYTTNHQTKQHPKTSFGAIYGIKGDINDVNKTLEMAKKNVGDVNILELKNKVFAFLTFSNRQNDSIKAQSFLKEHPALITDAKILTEPSDIIGFNFWNGAKIIREKLTQNGDDFFRLNYHTPADNIAKNTPIRLINFAAPKTLTESLSYLSDLGRKFKLTIGEERAFILDEFSKFLPYKKALSEMEDFSKNKKIIGLKGYGGFSTAFLTEDTDVLKISLKPNTPKTVKNYDMEVFDKTKTIINRAESMYGVKQQNGQSYIETWIKPEDVETIKKQITQEGDNLSDYDSVQEHQLAKTNRGIFLIDAQCSNRPLWTGDK